MTDRTSKQRVLAVYPGVMCRRVWMRQFAHMWVICMRKVESAMLNGTFHDTASAAWADAAAKLPAKRKRK